MSLSCFRSSLAHSLRTTLYEKNGYCPERCKRRSRTRASRKQTMAADARPEICTVRCEARTDVGAFHRSQMCLSILAYPPSCMKCHCCGREAGSQGITNGTTGREATVNPSIIRKSLVCLVFDKERCRMRELRFRRMIVSDLSSFLRLLFFVFWDRLQRWTDGFSVV